ncbi:MAG: membrane dipeptidase [Clostridia bacterium]|nr:membrane dipeptidase [Clostridia bacterium]
MHLIDFHCDTPVELYKKQACLAKNDLMVDLKKASAFQSYTQLAAVFYPPQLPNADGMHYVRSVLEYLEQAGALIIGSRDAMQRSIASGAAAFIPCIEDARVLNGDLHNVTELFALGVRFATLLWRDESIIGGAWNTNVGLTSFGKKAVIRFLEAGITVDASHASVSSFHDMSALCKAYQKPLVATHSNAFSVTPHRRNLTDGQIRTIALSGGVIGVNLYPPFLTSQTQATLNHVMAHIRHLMRVGGEECVVLGSDLDGVDALPRSIFDVSNLSLLTNTMKKSGFTARQTDRFFFENGHRFLIENLP